MPHLLNIAWEIACLTLPFIFYLNSTKLRDLYNETLYRGLFEGRTQDEFLNRKNRFSLNVQLIGGKNRLIYDVDFRCPGQFHDARVWRFSETKQYLEQRWPRFLLAGDSAYPKSTVLVTPYTEAEAQNDASKRLFNLRYKTTFHVELLHQLEYFEIVWYSDGVHRMYLWNAQEKVAFI